MVARKCEYKEANGALEKLQKIAKDITFPSTDERYRLLLENIKNATYSDDSPRGTLLWIREKVEEALSHGG